MAHKLKKVYIRAVPDLGHMRPCASKVIKPLTWALKEVDPVGLHRQVRHTCSGNLGIVEIFKLHHISKNSS